MYRLTCLMYCWAGAVCHRPANQRPTQPHTSPAWYCSPRGTFVEPDLVAVVAGSPAGVGGVGVHRGGGADPWPAGFLERVPVLQDAVVLGALARPAVLAEAVTWRAGGPVRAPVAQRVLLPPALHGGLGEDDVLVDAPLAGSPAQYLAGRAGEVAVDARREQLTGERAVGRGKETGADLLAGGLVVAPIRALVLFPRPGKDPLCALRTGR